MSSTGSTAAAANSNDNNNNNNNTNKRTRLDRSLPILLTNDDDDTTTPSRRDGIDGPTERLYRLYGASLLAQGGGRFLRLRPTVVITARVIWQRLLHRVSLRHVDVWATVMGALLCAAKTEEASLTARQLIVVFVHLYRRRRLLSVPSENDDDDDDARETIQELTQRQRPHPVVTTSKHVHAMTLTERHDKLRSDVPALPSTGPIWKEWFDALVQAEAFILRSLGFLLYWIPQYHAHRFLPGFCQALGLTSSQGGNDNDSDDKDTSDDQKRHRDDDDETRMMQRIWNACHDAYRLDACVRYPPEVICAAALFVSVPSLRNTATGDWWTPLLGPGRAQALVDCANLLQSVVVDATGDVRLAEVAFLKDPLGSAESFNGPRSFVWEMDEGNLG